MNNNNNNKMIDTNGNNYNYDLPPIRKVGPAVLPKPKNIKIQAGRGNLLISKLYCKWKKCMSFYDLNIFIVLTKNAFWFFFYYFNFCLFD